MKNNVTDMLTMKTQNIDKSPSVSIDERWINLEKDIVAIKKLLIRLLEKVSPENVHDDPVLNVKQVAQLLGVEPAAVYTKCSQGNLPHFKMGKRYKFKRSAVNEWMERPEAGSEINVEDYVNQYLQKKVLKG